jgi:hypothetical protein
MLRRTFQRAVPQVLKSTVHYEMPIEQHVLYTGRPVPLRFAENAAAWVCHDEELRVARTHGGVILQAVNEEAMTKAAAVLREIYGDEIQLLPAQVRYIEGVQLLEPVMHFRIECPAACAAPAKRALAARRAEIFDEEVRGERYFVRGIAALVSLLGHAQRLQSLCDGQASFWSWLSHYAPVSPDGGRAA